VLLPMPHGLIALLLCAALGYVALSDLRVRRIPNALVAAVAAAGLVHAVAYDGAVGAAWSVAGALGGVVLLFLPFRQGLLGAGDVKLLGALGAWAGPVGVLRVLLVGSVLGGVVAAVYLLRLARAEREAVRANLGAFVRGTPLVVPATEHLGTSRGIPYGLALAAAGAWVLLSAGGGVQP
jgi:prepilin peptidase CpaA